MSSQEKVFADRESAILTGRVDDVERQASHLCTPAQAFWKHREWLRSQRDLILSLSAAIGCTSNFTTYQWAQIAAFTAQFRPDLILELGRRFGNSTACFTQVANYLGGAEKCNVLSLCLSDDWEKTSFPKLKTLVPAGWFAPTEIRQCNILTSDIARELNQAQRIVVFWDAHGFEVAEWVLGELLPNIASKPHLVIMHDLSDARYADIPQSYGGAGLWKGMNDSDVGMMIGHVYSRVAQAISITDFSARNHLPLYSADESFHAEFAGDAEKCAGLRASLGEELFQMQCHWFWFTLNGRDDITFPKFSAPRAGPMIGRDYAELRAELESIYNSAGWRALNRWRSLRDAVAPSGTQRRKVYGAVRNMLLRRGRRHDGSNS